MSRKQIWRMAVDLAMTVILLLLMGYSRIGETAHEVLGVCMFTLFILHHILNRKWIAGIFKGKYSAYRIFQTVLVALLFVTMTGSAVSGIILSKHLFNAREGAKVVMTARGQEKLDAAVKQIREKAHSCYMSKDAFQLLKGDNKELMIIPDAVHTDLYDGGDHDYIPFDKMTSFFEEYLK